MARGISEIMGIRLMVNFDRPYAARSVTEFWRRWHISLSTWFRDYVYIPLGGNRLSPGRHYVTLLVVFLISGLWHGASWTFVIWGALHGLYLIGGRVLTPVRVAIRRCCAADRFPGWTHAINVCITFSLVTLAWVFFRASHVGDAIYIVGHLFRGWNVSSLLRGASMFPGLPGRELILSIGLIVFMELIQWLHSNGPISERLAVYPSWVHWTAYSVFVLVFSLIVMISNPTPQKFIYFQF